MLKYSRNCSLDISDEGKNIVVTLKGEIDHHSAVWVRTEIDERIARLKPERTVLDLSGIDFMDSSGIGLIMGRYKRMQNIGGVLVVRNPNERIIKIFELAGLSRIVSIEKTKRR